MQKVAGLEHVHGLSNGERALAAENLHKRAGFASVLGEFLAGVEMKQGEAKGGCGQHSPADDAMSDVFNRCKKGAGASLGRGQQGIILHGQRVCRAWLRRCESRASTPAAQPAPM